MSSRCCAHHENFSKRLIKTPKLYFLDTGLLCFLLRVGSADELHHHAARGAIFESFVISELYKNYYNQGEQPGLYFWRDTSRHEVDVLIDLGAKRVPVEIKSARTLTEDFFKGLEYWRSLAGQPEGPAALVYGGDQCQRRNNAVVYPWFAL